MDAAWTRPDVFGKAACLSSSFWWNNQALTQQVEAALPGVLQAVHVHDGPPHGPGQVRVAVAQNHALATWAVTAQVTHPGIGMADGNDRDRQGHGLAELLDLAARTELIEEMLFTVPSLSCRQ